MIRSVYDLPEMRQGDDERFDQLLSGQGSIRLERIVSFGHTTPEGEWYDQGWDEWVTVLEGEAVLTFADGKEIRLERGMHAFLPRHNKHRVAYTSSPCIWLAVHGDLLSEKMEGDLGQ